MREIARMEIDDKKFPYPFSDRFERFDHLKEEPLLPDSTRSDVLDRATIDLQVRIDLMRKEAERLEEEFEEKINRYNSDYLRFDVDVSVEAKELEQVVTPDDMDD
jgi:hypothetical protein